MALMLAYRRQMVVMMSSAIASDNDCGLCVACDFRYNWFYVASDYVASQAYYIGIM